VNKTNRRDFLQSTALAGAGFWLAGGVSLAEKKEGPSDKLRIACIGVGGKGSSDTDQAGEVGDLVALCDIDDNHLGQKAKKFPKAKKYNDFRKMFDEMGKSIDAVVVSTPDHTHTLPSMIAMQLGKGVYCQKPLTHTVFEARQMREAAKKYKVATQMGNQGTAETGLRRAVEFVQAGGIGAVREAHVWTNRPIWPQAPAVTKRLAPSDCPPHVHWDLFLGPAPQRPYADGYHPFKWRGWWDFGTGALGDMACHTANMAFMALKLAHPLSIVAEAGDVNPETCPSFAQVVFEFPARESMPALKFFWYEGKKEGKNVLPAPELVKGQGERTEGFAIYFKDGKWFFRDIEEKNPKKQVKTVSSGSFLIGEKAVLFSPDDYGAKSFLVTEAGVEKLTGKLEKLPNNGGGDQGMKSEWAAAIRGGPAALSNFDYAGMLTETILLGNVAIRVGKKLEWDGPNMKATNCPEADQYIKTEYRKGWSW